MAGADAGLAEEDGTAGRLAFDQRGEDGDQRNGYDESDERAEEVDGALERAVEEPADGELLDAEDVVAVPGTAFGAGGEWFFRLSYAAGPEAISEGLRRINRFLLRH